MVFAPGIFVAFLVVVEQRGSVASDADVFHRYGRVEAWASALRTCQVDLGKLCAGEGDRLRVGHQCGLKQDVSVVQESYGRFVSRMGCDAFGHAPFLSYDVHVHAPPPVGGESQAFSVGTPYGVRVVGCVSCQLCGLSSLCRHCKDISLVAEGNGASVGRYGAVLHP